MNTITFKRVLSCLMLFVSIAMVAQERGKINGTVTLSGNTPAENISVALKGTVYSAVTGQSGQYEIKNVKPGTYTLRVSAVGITSMENTVTVAAGETVTKDFALAESQQQLDEVVIDGNSNKFSRKQSDIVAKMPLKDIENPQVYNTITSEVLKQQVVTNFDDALKNAPGLDKLWESTGRGTDGAGYFSLRGFAVQPTMINGVPGLTNGSPDPANIERIDVIKGPSGTLFGSSVISYGGLINVTTKRPYDTFGGNVSYTGGSYGLNRTTLDINTPLNKENGVNLRLNAAYHTEGSFQDAGFRESFFVAPSLTYKASDRLSFLVNAEFYNGKSTNPTMLFLDRGNPLLVHNMDELKYDNRRSYTSNDLYMETPTFNFQGVASYKINDNWTSQSILSRTSAKSSGYYSYLYEATQSTTTLPDQTVIKNFAGLESGIVLARYLNKQNSETYGTDIQQNFIGEFNLGTIKNKFVGGLDYFTRTIVDNGSGYGMNGLVYIGDASLQNVNESVFKITNPDFYITDGDSGILTQAATDAVLAGADVSPTRAKQEIFSAYASDVAYLTSSLSVMASLRIDHFKNDNGNQTTLSPKFGAVYQILPEQLSVFANYMNGFVNTDPTTNFSASAAPKAVTFDPEHANQFEFGTKVNLFNDKLTGSVSYYNTEVSNMVYTLYGPTADNPDNIQTSVQGGEQRNKGVEVSLTANPIEGLNILAGYSYNESKLTAGDPDFVGRRPESAGPQIMANLWASYRFNQGILNGFGLGFGGNTAGKNKIFSRNLGGTFVLPEYTVLNASVFYNIDAFAITLKVDNLTNEEYYKGWSTINPQKPRVFAANLTYNF
ncbi:TonB-dependent siderophore receptor [Flavobacterium hauense]